VTKDDAPQADEDRREFAEEADTLWEITIAPAIWALHFLLCYGLMSLACAKDLFPAGTVRLVLIAASVAALAAIVGLGLRSLRQWGALKTGEITHPRGTPENRHRFLGHAAFLLSVIAFLGVIFVSMPLLVIGGCQ